MSSAVSESELTFGVISDVQYADHDDALPRFPPIRKRYYRRGLGHVKRAALDCTEHRCEFLLQLGDLIDGKSKKESEKALHCILDVMKGSGIPFHNTLGNHELYNFSHNEATAFLIRSETGKAYYSFQPREYVKVICLDTYDIGVTGRSKTDPVHAMGEKYLAINPNEDQNGADGLEGNDRRFVKFNGAIGEGQLTWLSSELVDSEQKGQKVVVFGHCGILPEATDPHNLLWNYEEVLPVLEKSSSVALVLSGHMHAYKHAVSPHGKHFISFRGVIETPPTGKAWGIVKLTKERITFKIHDDDQTREWEASI